MVIPTDAEISVSFIATVEKGRSQLSLGCRLVWVVGGQSGPDAIGLSSSGCSEGIRGEAPGAASRFKSTLLISKFSIGRSLDVSTTVYYYDYKDTQIYATVQDPFLARRAF